jgi:zinc transporter 1
MFLFHGHSHGHSHAHADEEQQQDIIESVTYNYGIVRMAEKLHEQEQELEHQLEGTDHHHNEETPLLSHSNEIHNHSGIDSHDHSRTQSHTSHDHNHAESHSHDHHSHDYHSHDHHSHGDMNMHGLFLHILGDLLASLGVIASSCVMIFVKESWTIYLDPAMSLLITFIIVYSTLPLVKSASYILLQGIPNTISIERIRRELLRFVNIIDIHELHIWQLSEGQTIASVHVVVPSVVSGESFTGPRYMQLANSIRKRLHDYGIHSTTIQPEFKEQISSTVIIVSTRNQILHACFNVKWIVMPKLAAPKNK